MIKKLAFQGLKWSFLQQFFVLFINYGTLLILADLIEPKYHGIMVLVSIPTGFTGVLGTMGVREKILKENTINEASFKSIMGLVIAISVLLTFVTLIITVIVCAFYAKQYSFCLLFKLGFALSLITPLSVFNNYFEGLQSRQLKFKKQNILSIVSIAIGGVVSIFLAYTKQPYDALVVKLLLPNVLIFLGYIFFLKVNFSFNWSCSLLIEMKTFISYFTSNSIFNYLVRNIDYIIIGKFFPAEILGQYSIAYKILLFPMRTITSRVNAVLLPVLAKINPDTQNFKQKYFLVITVLSFIIFPLMAFVSLTTAQWVSMVFNSNYTLLPQMISVLAVVGMFQALVTPVGTLFLIKENLKLMLSNSIFASIVVTTVYLFSSIFLDIQGVIMIFALTWIFLLMPITIFAAFRPYEYSFLDFMRSILPALISTLIAGAILLLTADYLKINYLLKLLLEFMIFIIIFIGMYHILTRKSKNSLSYLISFTKI